MSEDKKLEELPEGDFPKNDLPEPDLSSNLDRSTSELFQLYNYKTRQKLSAAFRGWCTVDPKYSSYPLTMRTFVYENRTYFRMHRSFTIAGDNHLSVSYAGRVGLYPWHGTTHFELREHPGNNGTFLLWSNYAHAHVGEEWLAGSGDILVARNRVEPIEWGRVWAV
jgi:hypothetical protein